jgi:hypothetical protein
MQWKKHTINSAEKHISLTFKCRALERGCIGLNVALYLLLVVKHPAYHHCSLPSI